MSKFKTAIILNDIHFPKHNPEAVRCAVAAINLIKPDIIDLNGDIVDCGTVSRHTRFAPPKCYWNDSQYLEELQKEYNSANMFLDLIGNIIPKAQKIYKFGNHEYWTEEFIEESPKARRGLFDLATNLKLKKRGYSVYPYGAVTKLGKLKVTHGFYTGQHHAKKHVDMFGSSVLYGHTHDIQVHSKVTPENDTHMAWCNGCLSDLNPAYLRNKPQNWNHGFAIVYVFPNGNFQVDLKRITKGKVVVDGQVIGG